MNNLDYSLNKKKNPIVLECRNVFKEYKDADFNVKVLSGVAFQVERGEQVAIMGRSGSGKTTLLQLLGGLDLPSQGEIFVNGKNIQHLSERNREMMRNNSLGFIYQMHHLLPEFSALENVAMPLLIAKELPKIAKQKAEHLLELVGLKPRLQHRPSELSGGERQRVAIARALVNEPDCVLADEPTGNLDDESASHVFEVMQELNRKFKTSIIIVTHDSSLAARLDRTMILQGGKLHLAG